MVTGYNSGISFPHPLMKGAFANSNTIPTTPGDIVLLTNNDCHWSGCEGNVDLSDSSRNEGRASKESGEESHVVCMKIKL
jgi:hypothetical protein